MMNVLLKRLCEMPLTPPEVVKFLHRVSKLVIIDEITTDDWKYLLYLLK